MTAANPTHDVSLPSMMNKNVRYPEMRREIYLSIKQFSDPEFQRRSWLSSPDGPARDEGADFDFPFHILYDDSPGLEEDPHSTIGEYLLDNAEASAIKSLFSILTPLLDRFGPLGKAEQFISAREWPRVIRAASAAVALMEQNDGM